MASVVSFRGFANSCSLYSLHLSKGVLARWWRFPVHYLCRLVSPWRVFAKWSSALHSFSNKLFLSLRIGRCTSFRNLLYSVISPLFLAYLLSAARWIVSLLIQALFRFCRSLTRISSAESFHIVSMSFQMWLKTVVCGNRFNVRPPKIQTNK